MALGKSIRVYLADGKVSGIRHGEIVNWTGQAIACPRARFNELKEWTEELKRPGVYFLFGQVEETGKDAVYVGEAEVVLDRLSAHLSGKMFWNEVVAFTSKDPNLIKGHVRYLESRLVELAKAAGRYEVRNTASPQLPALSRADRDWMEDFISCLRILLGVLGHRVLEPLVQRALPTPVERHETQAGVPSLPEEPTPLGTPVSALPTFQLQVKNLFANAVRTDEGLVVLAKSEVAPVGKSLATGHRALRDRLLDTGVIAKQGEKLAFVSDYLFTSPTQAAAVIVGTEVNGREAWKTPNGITYSDFEAHSVSDGQNE